MFSITMINRNGYMIRRNCHTIIACKNFASFYPLESFFSWIYNVKKDKMVYQSEYSKHWKKCNNETFVPYWCY